MKQENQNGHPPTFENNNPTYKIMNKKKLFLVVDEKSFSSYPFVISGRGPNSGCFSVEDENIDQESNFRPTQCAHCDKYFIPGCITNWKALGFCSPECYLTEMWSIGRKPEILSPVQKFKPETL